jgi:hypothetical protein
MSNNKFQRSIHKTRQHVTAFNRSIATVGKRRRVDAERARAELELFLDAMVQEGVELSDENVMLFVSRFLEQEEETTEPGLSEDFEREPRW